MIEFREISTEFIDEDFEFKPVGTFTVKIRYYDRLGEIKHPQEILEQNPESGVSVY